MFQPRTPVSAGIFRWSDSLNVLTFLLYSDSHAFFARVVLLAKLQACRARCPEGSPSLDVESCAKQEIYLIAQEQ